MMTLHEDKNLFVWKQLRGTYETKIPPLAYVQPIPSADATADAFRLIVRELSII